MLGLPVEHPAPGTPFFHFRILLSGPFGS